VIDETASVPERRVAFVHRVIVPNPEFPREYSILVTNRRLIFIRQKKTRSKLVLNGEMRYGTALITDVDPPKMGDYDRATLESLKGDPENLVILHERITSLVMKKDAPTFRYRDFFIWLTMRRQQEIFQVYHFDMTYAQNFSQDQLRFYMVPLGAWFKPRRQTQTREGILREYASDGLQIFQQFLPSGVVVSAV
jgi:hypothetical protein